MQLSTRQTASDSRYFAGFVVASLIFLGYMMLLNIPLQAHHIVGIALIIAAICIIASGGALPRSTIVISALGIPLVARNILTADWAGLLFAASYVGVISALIVVGRKRQIPAAIMPVFLLVGVLPEFAYSKWIRGPIARHEYAAIARTGIFPTLIPTAKSDWRVSLGPYGVTYHYTADIGVILFAIALINIQARRKSFILLPLASYLVIFSGARTGIAAMVMVTLTFIINKNRRRPAITWGILGAFIAISYGLAIISLVAPTEMVRALSRKSYTNPLKLDPTSSRSWLWAYQTRIFMRNPVTGGGFEETRVNGDKIVDGQFAPAGNESFYTALLAAFGISGCAIIAIHLYMFGKTTRHPDLLKLLFATILITETVLNSMASTTYWPPAFFLLAYISCNLDSKKIGRPVIANRTAKIELSGLGGTTPAAVQTLSASGRV